MRKHPDQIDLSPQMIGRTSGERVPVYFGGGRRSHLGALLGEVPRVEIVSDRNVAARWLPEVGKTLQNLGHSVGVNVLPAGEGMKNSRTVSRLHESWFDRKCNRCTPVIALGGGAVGDTAGFAAATFMRGLPLWQSPTSLLAQVDAAIGGKVGINHPRGKNLIGCFYQPTGILVDPEFLSTLPQPELISGLAEVVKYGLITDPGLFRRCERGIPVWISGRRPVPDEVIRKCIRIKLDVVAKDERDFGLRHMLNFGHTIGHALERWTNYKGLRHGEAVALGMVGAGFIASAQDRFARSEFDRLLNVCHHLIPVQLPKIPAGDIIRHLGMDKKRVGGGVRWVLPSRIGQVETTDKVSEKEIRNAISFLNEFIRG